MTIEKFEDILAWQKAKQLTFVFISYLKRVEILVLKIKYSAR
jgi:hypothetical protein